MSVKLIFYFLLLTECTSPKFIPTFTTHVRLTVGTLSKNTVKFGGGTGIIIGRSKDKLIVLTAKHVVAGSIGIFAKTSLGNLLGEVYYLDKKYDLALVKLDYKNLTSPSMQLEYRTPIPGSRIWVLGTASGGTSAVVNGVVSSLPRKCEDEDETRDCFISNMTIGPGFSGSGVLSLDGKLVGIVVEYLSSVPHLGIFIGIERIRKFIVESKISFN